jgi:integrase/recombinase XerD
MEGLPTTLSQSIEQFKTYLIGKEKSLNTIKGYYQDLNHFSQWLQERYDPPHLINHITSLDLKEYEQDLKANSSIAPTTINRRLVAIKRWTDFLVESGSIPFNIGTDISVAKIQKQNNVRWLSRREVGQLLHAVEFTKRQNYHKGLFHQTTICLMVNLGLRVQEICDLKIINIDQQRGLINIKGKGSKYRLIPLTDNTVSIINLWLKERKKESEFLLVSSKSEKLTPRAVQHILKKYSKQLALRLHLIR